MDISKHIKIIEQLNHAFKETVGGDTFLIQCPNCHQEVGSYTEHSPNGITKVIICTCGYINRKILCDVMENNPLDIQINTYSSMGVGAAKKNKKTKRKNKRGFHDKK